MKYINQLEYPHIPYHTNMADARVENKESNVAREGCGPSAICMMIDLLTNRSLTIEECIHISEECGATPRVGTDMTILGPVIAEKYDLTYGTTMDPEEAIRHLQNGGQVISLVGIPEGKTIGLFTRSGHYINLISCDGKEFCILDPSYTPEKYEIPERKGRVNTATAPFLYCDVETVDSETKPNRIKYFLFARKKG